MFPITCMIECLGLCDRASSLCDRVGIIILPSLQKKIFLIEQKLFDKLIHFLMTKKA